VYPNAKPPSHLSPTISRWCAHVTVTPLLTSRNVFKRGTPLGLIGLTPTGGHTCPAQIEGENAKWKKVHKKEKNNITSLNINILNLNFKLSSICKDCSPLPISHLRSLHQQERQNRKKQAALSARP
jgi:hypothetical protein